MNPVRSLSWKKPSGNGAIFRCTSPWTSEYGKTLAKNKIFKVDSEHYYIFLIIILNKRIIKKLKKFWSDFCVLKFFEKFSRIPLKTELILFWFVCLILFLKKKTERYLGRRRWILSQLISHLDWRDVSLDLITQSHFSSDILTWWLWKYLNFLIYTDLHLSHLWKI